MEHTIKLCDEITAASVQLARIALRQDQGDYGRGYVQALHDVLAVLNISGDLPAASAWNVQPLDIDVHPLHLPGSPENTLQAG